VPLDIDFAVAIRDCKESGMTRTGYFSLLAIVAVSLCCVQQSNAADEDTAASVYLVFDAETGEFITVEDDGGNARVDQETQESIDAGLPHASVADGASDGSKSTSLKNPIIGGAIGALIVGGFFAWRRSQKSAAS
jgi:hypothetical protein